MTSAINEAAAENKHTSPQICTQCTLYVHSTHKQYLRSINFIIKKSIVVKFSDTVVQSGRISLSPLC